MDSNRLIAYDEPNSDNSNCHTVLTVTKAIEIQMLHASAVDYKYSDDAEALHDFMAVHWAYFVEPDGVTKIL